MAVNAANITLLLFTVFSSLRIVSYLPQIRAVAIDANGATAISYSTWSIWTGANIATALYAAINLHDFFLSAVSAVYAVCCIAVILLTALQRRRLRMRSAAHGKTTPSTADRDNEAERGATAEALRMTVEAAAAALAANRRPHYMFEQELAGHTRRLVWHDLAKAFSGLGLPPPRRVRAARRGRWSSVSNEAEMSRAATRGRPAGRE
jgi:hypothetical protein